MEKKDIEEAASKGAFKFRIDNTTISFIKALEFKEDTVLFMDKFGNKVMIPYSQINAPLTFLGGKE